MTANEQPDDQIPPTPTADVEIVDDQNTEEPLTTVETSTAADETNRETDPSLPLPTGSTDQVPPSLPSEPETLQPKKSAWLRPLRWSLRHKKWTIPLKILLILLILLAVPCTRYKLLAPFDHRPVSFTVIDSTTNTPISGAILSVDGKKLSSSDKGMATFDLSAGKQQLVITKQYYKTDYGNYFVSFQKSHDHFSVSLVATGRQVPITIENRITGLPLADATVTVLDTRAQTDKTGQAIIVLPTTAETRQATVTLNGFNQETATIDVTANVVGMNTIKLTPSGRVYFLSNLSGKIDVVSTNLDGTDRQTVLAGTGNEDPPNTSLLASRDWQYLVLYANRDGGANPSVYLINTKTDKLTTVDEGNATFNLIGWSNHNLIYEVTRSSVNDWQSGQYVLKSYNADTGKLAIIDQTTASGTDEYDWVHQEIDSPYIVGNQVYYLKNVYGTSSQSTELATQQATLNVINNDGSDPKIIKSFSLDVTDSGSTVSLGLELYEPDGFYVSVNDNGNQTFYDYDDGQLTLDSKLTSQLFYDTNYNTYLLSPSGNQTFWSENQDGKNSLFIGNAGGDDPQEIAKLSDYNPYGWYTDNYLLVSKNSSELYIMPSSGSAPALKISDYFKPQTSYNGYGGGYGGH